jgi:hypothetical protein
LSSEHVSLNLRELSKIYPVVVEAVEMCEMAAAISKGGGKGGETASSLSHAFHGPAFPRSYIFQSIPRLPNERSADALQIALRAARENEARWMEMSPEFSGDGDRMEQWASTAKLRRLEIKRIEILLAEVDNPSPGPTLR